MRNCRPDGEFVVVTSDLLAVETSGFTRGYEREIAECTGFLAMPSRPALAFDPLALMRPQSWQLDLPEFAAVTNVDLSPVGRLRVVTRRSDHRAWVSSLI